MSDQGSLVTLEVPVVSDSATQVKVAEAVQRVLTEPQVTWDEFQKVKLQIGKILSAERIPKSEKCLKLTVSFGAEKRTVVSGIGRSYQPEDLVGNRYLFVTNFPPRKIMGINSEAMILAAGEDPELSLFSTTKSTEPGKRAG